MTKLAPVYSRFERRLDVLEDEFAAWVAESPRPMKMEDHMFLEGLISTVWQHWSLFCRRLVIASALGCKTRSGVVVAACVTPATWGRVSYIASRVKNDRRVHQGKENSLLRKEPTWGDVQRLQDVLNELRPCNLAQLSQCFGSISRGPIHVQVVRNAAAHRNLSLIHI